MKVNKEELIKEALDFELNYRSFKTRNEKVIASRKAKELILSINEFYKETKEDSLMDLMKKLTVVKKKIEVRLNGRLTSS